MQHLRPNLWVIVFLACSGCATGKTDFKIFKATSTPAATAVASQTPEPVGGPSAILEASVPTRTAAAEASYTVQEGDSLWRICRRLLHDPLRYAEVARTNHIQNPDLIQPRQILYLNQPAEEPKPASQESKSPAPQATALPTPRPAATIAAVSYPTRPNRAFAPGEKLTFSVEYFGISAGYATLSVEEGPAVRGRPTLHLIATARTHPAFEWFFVVRDRIESIFDRAGCFSWRYEKHLREGGYSNDSVMLYNQDQRKIVKDEGRTTLDAPAWVQDVVSEFYYYRTLHVTRLGEVTTFPVVADDGKSYEVVVNALRRETIQVPAGKFSCIVVEPHIKFEGLFQQKGKVEIWLTDDERQVPVLIKSAIVIGTIDIVLRDAEVVDVGKE